MRETIVAIVKSPENVIAICVAIFTLALCFSKRLRSVFF